MTTVLGRIQWECMYVRGGVLWNGIYYCLLSVIQVGSVLVDIVLESLKIPNVLKSIENLT